MEYRTLPHGGESISIIGLGTSSIGATGERETEEVVRMAVENGINYFDMASADAVPFVAYGRALADVRSKVYMQIHFGADYKTGTYAWTVNLDNVKRSLDWQLRMLKTDYIDFGFIHCIDETKDWQKYVEGGIFDYLQQMKSSGVVHHIGLSSHTPVLANKVLDTGMVDMLMFSINPGYDYRQEGEFAIGSAGERMTLYRRCETEGVGISVMKPFGGGQLLDARTSPFKQALTEVQCIQYALDKPGVLTVLPGIRDREDLRRILSFTTASKEEKNYAILDTFIPHELEGTCVYCNHCQPCPKHINIGLINKYYDLACAGDYLAREHYDKLEVKADACNGCGHCNRRCPFHVDQISRMKQIAGYFKNHKRNS